MRGIIDFCLSVGPYFWGPGNYARQYHQFMIPYIATLWNMGPYCGPYNTCFPLGLQGCKHVIPVVSYLLCGLQSVNETYVGPVGLEPGGGEQASALVRNPSQGFRVALPPPNAVSIQEHDSLTTEPCRFAMQPLSSRPYTPHMPAVERLHRLVRSLGLYEWLLQHPWELWTSHHSGMCCLLGIQIESYRARNRKPQLLPPTPLNTQSSAEQQRQMER